MELYLFSLYFPSFYRTTDYTRNTMNLPMLVSVEGGELLELLFSSVKCENMAILAIINVAPNA